MSASSEQIAAALRASAKEAEALRRQNRRLREAAAEPIAIVGMSCRYPGGVRSPEDLWQLVSSGSDAVGDFPRDRGWDVDRIYHPDPDNPGTSYVRRGGFVADAGEFDPAFFGISPREARIIDPQARLLLESSWEGLEDAGLDPRSLQGSQAGVFAGLMYHDYGWGLGPSTERGAPLATNTGGSAVPGLVAYTLGLEGPALAVDTACSSSLVAMHLAVHALRKGECDLALAGGVTVHSTPGAFIYFSRQRGLAPDGHSKPFAEGADGVGVSEGVGLLVLERLSDAQRADRRILATIRGGAVNQDGASNGFTAPNGPSQERVIRQALANAGLEPADVEAVEAHGTGTMLGDPIEAGALLATYGQDREQPLRLGSIKSNIGHSQAAAGVAGVIKMTMAMREGVLPKTLHVDRPSTKVDWEAGKIELLTEQLAWEPNGSPRRAGVSSFGASGTNAHLILEEAPDPPGSRKEGGDDRPLGVAEPPLQGQLPLVLSAKTEPALREAASRLRSRLLRVPDLDPLDVAHSLATTRSSFEHRGVALGPDRERLLGALQALATGTDAPDAVRDSARPRGRPVFLFPGQGAQWPGMAAELLEASPPFARKMRECQEALEPHIEWSFEDVLCGGEPTPPERPDILQPTLFAMTVSLTELWRSVGVEPAAVLGQSQGEIAAVHVAGGLGLEEAARAVALRSRVLLGLVGRGKLVSVGLGGDALRSRLEPWGGQIEIAVLAGPSSAVLSGEGEALEELMRECEAEGVRAKDIPGGVGASHSAYVEDLREELLEALGPISPRSGEIPFHSTVTGGPIDTAELDAEYWYRNLRQPVLLEPTVRALLASGNRALIEVSPHPVLAIGLQETVEAAIGKEEAAVLSTLRRDEGGPERFTLSLAGAHASGVEVAWERFFEGMDAKRVPLPTYPFQRKRYWLAAPTGSTDASAIGQADPDHPLLGAAVEEPEGKGLTLTGRLSLVTHPWLADHAVFGTVLLPGTAFVELTLRAGREVGCELLEELTLEAPLVLPEEGAVIVQVTAGDPDDDGRWDVSIHSRADEEGEREWTRHASGTLSPQAPQSSATPVAWPPEGAVPLDIELLYERLAAQGVNYGPAFQGVRAAWQLGDDLYAEVSLPEEQADEAARFDLHPALLDATSHVGIDLALSGAGSDDELPLPFSWRGVRFGVPGASSLRVAFSPVDDGHRIVATDESGEPVALVESVVARPIERRRLEAAAGASRSLYGIEWCEPPPRMEENSDARVAILGGAELGDLGAEAHADLRSLLEAIEGGAPVPDLVLADARGGDRRDAGVLDAFHAATEDVLALAQAWVSAEALGSGRLVLLTEGAVAVEKGEDPDLAAAPSWGLIRSAGSEHPGRFALIDTDRSDASLRALSAALLASSEEPQLALREGRSLVPRLSPVSAAAEPSERRIDPDSTILITGGTSGVGALVARRLATEHGARHLLLTSRSGPDAREAPALEAELGAAGCEVEIKACDVGDREQLERLLDSIPAEHPLGAVVHSAAALDDGVIGSMSPERLERVFAPKADAAWHLHELTSRMELARFLMFSSATGIVGGTAQANYVAANTFLDALAAHREARGLPATALAWGAWGQRSNLAGELDEVEGLRMSEQIRERTGATTMSIEQGLELFDLAWQRSEPLLVPAPFDGAVLRRKALEGTLPAIFRRLVRVPEKRSRERGALAQRLAATPEAEREAVILDLVRTHVSAVLGHASAEEVEVERPFKDLGFDSLAAVELRNRLNAAAGLTLPATVVFDYPSAAALAEFLGTTVGSESRAPTVVEGVAASATDEPIAIVGMACRYPGGVTSPGELWQLVASGADVISAFPADRGWDLERLFDPDPDTPGTCYTREGGFLEGVADFDPGFFGISPREALNMDPQERVLLEASWEALEDAGIDPSSLRGSRTGVFAGAMFQDYGAAVGMTTSTVTGRIAYTLGLEGPTLTVDTACSSSLVAIHLAVQALRGGECTRALAGGVAIPSTPGMLVAFSKQRGLAPDGRCKAFAEAADGTGVSEGVGQVVLERLSDAQRAGRRILATIRGSAVNQDGATNGITAPSGPSQERVIRQALANAGLAPGDVAAVEAHGTGTMLGDPIEAGALLATYGQDREEPLRLGSIKSNLGHAQAAAGVAGVIKMTMAMREGALPKTLHVDAPSSKVDWDAGKVELLTEQLPWEADGRPRRAGVSSFGASGTNAHLILEEAPVSDPGESDSSPSLSGPVPLAIAAKTEPALAEVAGRLAARLRARPELDPVDVAYSLVTGRAALERRAVVLGSDREELLEGLAALQRGEARAGVVEGRARSAARLAYLFTGQGSQRLGMGRELHRSHPAFASAFDETCAHLDAHLGRGLAGIVFGEGEEAARLLDDTTYAQPALFAVEVALFRLLESFGLAPSLLAGHSIGELSAAHVAGVLSLPDAAELVAARGRLMGELPAGGAMLAVQASEEEARGAIEGRERELALAAVNSSTSVVLSGEAKAIAEVQERWEAAGRKTKRLPVSHAFHSPLIEPMLEEFTQVAERVELHRPKITIVSNLTGGVLETEQATDPAYWVRHAREPVRFMDAVATLRAQGAAAFIELGPEATLTAMARECLAGDDPTHGVSPVLAPTLRAGRDEAATLTHAVASAHVQVPGLDWGAFFASAGARRVPLPTYPFQRKRYWVDSALFGPGNTGGAGQMALHPLLGSSVAIAGSEEHLLTGRLSLHTHAWLADHAVAGSALVPGAAFVELALRAGEEVGAEVLQELALQAPLVLAEGKGVQLQVSVGAPDDAGCRDIAVHSRPDRLEEDGNPGGWTCHAQGVLAATVPASPEPLGAWPPEGAEPLEVEELYERLAAHEVEYGPAFQAVRAAWKLGEEIFAEVSLSEEQAPAAERYGVHPALLDSVGHVGIDIALSQNGSAAAEPAALSLPFAWRGVRIGSTGATSLRVRAGVGEGDGGFAAYDEAGDLAISVESLLFRSLDPAQLRVADSRRLPLYTLEWIERDQHSPNGDQPPDVVLAPIPPAGEGEGASGAEAARVAAEAALAAAREHLSTDSSAASRLAVITTGAVAARSGESPDPALASVWGLIRSAQSEHPGRFCLIDTDGSEASDAALSSVLAVGAEEPQTALREGAVFVPRLSRAPAPAEPAPPIDPSSTVLVTGGTSGLGALVARHLAAEGGARRLLLVSRRGAKAEGVADLRAEIEELGAEVEIAACDVSDRDQVRSLLDSIPAENPLGVVYHCAGVVDDGMLESLDPERLERVMRPKAEAAWHLHELTEDLELSRFAMFSSVAGILGSPGQANYAAANAFLDALAQHRRANGLPATSLAWGPWALQTGMDAGLGEADRARLGAAGLSAIDPELGLELLDAACASTEASIAPVAFDAVALRARATAGILPPMLAGLVRVPRRGPERGSLAKRLAEVPEEDRQATILELVRTHVAAVLGHASGDEVDPETAFMDLGFDSLAAVELRNRLDAVTGLRLPPTVVFDYPSAKAVADHLLALVVPDAGAATGAAGEREADEALAKLTAALPSIEADDRVRSLIATRLRSLLLDLDQRDPGKGEDLSAMSDEEMFELIDEELGAS